MKAERPADNTIDSRYLSEYLKSGIERDYNTAVSLNKQEYSLRGSQNGSQITMQVERKKTAQDYMDEPDRFKIKGRSVLNKQPLMQYQMPIYLGSKSKPRQSFYEPSPKLKSIKGRAPNTTTMTLNLN